ncbi:hypothetical protein PV10_02337 [Exophiala mesophila]|uniref:TLDc domain-containing protein n=1 Tax=Exophiala mesophila TaxID=212818 RepID=A0A0D1ZKZ5_EXOME|nr:uncharacterized protein PV10_02337 [Exophiala mesophila]KIV94584.1 hypothetical protein PV10_02337 [Exophiala mesophila]
MGQSQSSEPPKEIPIEQLSHELALRFATRCFSHLEIAHYKDNFKTLADHQEDVEYWKEDTLCRFLALPEALNAGPVLYQMCTYLGAFPFPSLAPCILTREATLKVVTIMTGRYKKILKKGNQDKAKLLFRSLAVFDRKASVSSPRDKPDMQAIVDEQLPEDMKNAKAVETRITGFAIDDPINDGDEDEDEDDLALAALDSLDAIEVFKHDQRQTIDRKMNHALIPVDNFRKLITLLLLLASIEPLTPLGTYGESLTSDKIKALNTSADAIIAAFDPDPHSNGIRYQNFVKTVTFTLPDLFEPLSPLFEHLLFSKNINLNKHRDGSDVPVVFPVKASPIYRPSDDSASLDDTDLTDTLLSQLSTSLRLTTPTGIQTNIYTSNARFNLLYSTSSSGTSLSSFSRQVISWQSGTMLLLSGTTGSPDSQSITLGAYLPDRWTDSTNKYHAPSSSTSHDPNNADAPCLFLLSPRQAMFHSNRYNHTIPASYLHLKTGIALGCVIPPPSRSRSSQTAVPILGPVSVSIGPDMSTATFQHDGSAGQGAFTTDAGLELAQTSSSSSSTSSAATTIPTKTTISVTELEVWGITFPTEAEEDEMVKQAKRLAWEEAEAARRRGVNFGGDQDGARALLEMAGIVGDRGRSGGSV